MINSKTVFIVGAGASQEAGLPTGVDFKRRIADKLNIRFPDHIRMTSGDYQIENAIRMQVKQETPQHQDINPYLYAAWKICDALPQALSIDNVLDAHDEDSRIQFCGKLGIIRTILEAEHQSRLYFKPGEKPNYSVFESTWYGQFIKLVTENVRKTNLGNLFENISFITFNYDRSIEQYLVHALASYYALSLEESQALVNTLTIKHPYGQVGKLPFQSSAGPIAFGTIDRINLLPVVSQIKTFTEQGVGSADLEEIRKLIIYANTVVFLGFAFHELNMQLLDPKVPTDINRVFATAKGISNDDCSIIKDDIRSIIHSKAESTIVLNNHLTCSELFETHWRSLSR